MERSFGPRVANKFSLELGQCHSLVPQGKLQESCMPSTCILKYSTINTAKDMALV